MRSNSPDFSSQCSHLTAPKIPPKMVAPCSSGWTLWRYASRDRNDHHHPESSYVSDTALF